MTVASTPSSALSSGRGIVSTHFEHGTIGVIARTKAGEPRILTAAHVIGEGEEAFAEEDGAWRLGTCTATLASLSGGELYGASALHDDELFCIDAAAVTPAPGTLLRGGLLGQTSFVTEPSTSLVEWLLGAEVTAFGAKTGNWRTGTIVQLFPRRIDDGLTGFCLIEEDGDDRSHPGDSGSLWVAERDGHYVAVGLHWGVVDLDSAPRTFVVDVGAALGALGLASLVGDVREIINA